MHHNDTKERFIRLRAKGWSYNKISKEINVSKQTLINWSRELETEIANHKAIETESLLRKYSLTKQSKIRMFGERLKAINDELDHRDLKELRTEKLFGLLFKCAESIQSETGDLTFKVKEPIQTLSEFRNIEYWKG